MKKFMLILICCVIGVFSNIQAQSLFQFMIEECVDPRQKSFNDIKNFILLNDEYSISDIEDQTIKFSHRDFKAGDKALPEDIIVKKAGDKVEYILEYTYFWGQDNIDYVVGKFEHINNLFPQNEDKIPIIKKSIEGKYYFNNIKIIIDLHKDDEDATENFCPATIAFMPLED